MKIEKHYGIKYQLPEVYLVKNTDIGISEFAARTCYNSYDKSENINIKNAEQKLINNEKVDFNIENSELLEQLAWVHHHHSVLEHSVLIYYIKGISRGVLQELARHRIASYSVKSTRYTMSNIINVFNTIYFGLKYINYTNEQKKIAFINFIEELNLNFLITDKEYSKIEYKNIFEKLIFQIDNIGEKEFLNLSTSKDMKDKNIFENYVDKKETYKELLKCKQKRNIGDAFKHIVTDNWKTDLMMTMNLRSLKNFLILRDSGAAYFQIRWLAKEIKKVTPNKFLKLIIKNI